MDVVAAIVIGLLAGALGGLFGVGGGLIFVPTLVLLFGFGQVEAEATSLLAIIPVVLAGTWRQHLYGNVRWRAALVIGVVAVAGVELGVLTAKSLSEETLQRLFGLLLLVVAAQLAWRARRISSSRDGAGRPLAAARRRADRGDRREIEAEDPGLRELVHPEKLLAFRTFANIRVGIVLAGSSWSRRSRPTTARRRGSRASCGTRHRS